jgi:hypothetical protein
MARKLQPRERRLLGVMIVVAIGWLIYAYKPQDLIFGPAAARREEPTKPQIDAPVVRLDRLTAHDTLYDDAGRDLFKYYVPPPPPTPYRPPVATAPRPTTTETPRPRPVTSRPTEAPPPVPNFQYLGHLGPKDDRIFVFSANDEMILARIGEVVQDRFRVQRFDYDTVTLGYEEERYRGKTTELKMRAKK